MGLIVRNGSLLQRSNQLVTSLNCCECDEGICCSGRMDWPDTLVYTTNNTGDETVVELTRKNGPSDQFEYIDPFEPFTYITMTEPFQGCIMGVKYYYPSGPAIGPIQDFRVFNCKPFFAHFSTIFNFMFIYRTIFER